MIGPAAANNPIELARTSPVRSTLEWGAWLAVVAALLYFGLVFRPVATGGTVVELPLNPRDRWFGVAVMPSSVWMVGPGGRIVRSADGRRDWKPQKSGTASGLQDVAAWSAERAVAVGNEGTVLQTADGGATWTGTTLKMMVNAGKLMRVAALEGGAAYLAGESAAVFATGDFGLSWTRIHPESDQRWYGLAVRAPRQLIVVGEFGKVSVSDDGGASWHAAPLAEGPSLMAVTFNDRGTAVAVGLEGRMLRSTDGGRTWTELPKATDKHLFDVAHANGQWIAVGNFVRLISDDGLAWQAAVAEGQRTYWLTEVAAGSRRGEWLGVGEAPVRIEGNNATALYGPGQDSGAAR